MFDFDIELPKLKNDTNPKPLPENNDIKEDQNEIDAKPLELTNISNSSDDAMELKDTTIADFDVQEIELDSISKDTSESITDKIEPDASAENTIIMDPIIKSVSNTPEVIIDEPKIEDIVIPETFEIDNKNEEEIEVAPEVILEEISTPQANLEAPIEETNNSNFTPLLDIATPEVIDLSSFGSNTNQESPIEEFNIEPNNKVETFEELDNINAEIDNLAIPETFNVAELETFNPVSKPASIETLETENNNNVIETFDLDTSVENPTIFPSKIENLEDSSNFEEFISTTAVPNEVIINKPNEEAAQLEEFTVEEPIAPKPENTTPLGQTVLYDTPETTYEFKVDEPSVSTPIDPADQIGKDWAEKPIKENKKDPIVIISTLLIIASIIMAAVYYFVNNGLNIPFFTKEDPAIVQPNDNDNTIVDEFWPLHGTYSVAENEFCPDQEIELKLNEDGTFQFNDLILENEECSLFQKTGTYEESSEGMIVLTTSDGEAIPALFISVSTHAEIRIRGAMNIELTLYRNA